MENLALIPPAGNPQSRGLVAASTDHGHPTRLARKLTSSYLTRPVAATNVGRASRPVADALTAWEGRPTTCARRARILQAKTQRSA